MFATLSPSDEKVIVEGDEDYFLLYITSHIVLGVMFAWHRRLGSFFFPEVIKAIRKECGIPNDIMPLVIATMAELGYLRNGITKMEGKPTPFSMVTTKGQTNMAIWAFMGPDLVFEMVRQWRIRWGHDIKSRTWQRVTA